MRISDKGKVSISVKTDLDFKSHNVFQIQPSSFAEWLKSHVVKVKVKHKHNCDFHTSITGTSAFSPIPNTLMGQLAALMIRRLAKALGGSSTAMRLLCETTPSKHWLAGIQFHSFVDKTREQGLQSDELHERLQIQSKTCFLRKAQSH